MIKNTVSMKLYIKAGALMNEQGWRSNDDFADFVGLNKNTVNKFVNNSGNQFHKETIVKFCWGLNCKPEDLMELISDEEYAKRMQRLNLYKRKGRKKEEVK